MNKLLLSVLALGGGYFLWQRAFSGSPALKNAPPVIPGLGTKTEKLKAGQVYRLRGNVTPKVVVEDVAGMAELIGRQFAAIRSQIQQYAVINGVEKNASLVWMDVRPAADTDLVIDSKRWNWTRPNGRKYELSFIDVGTGLP